MTDFISRLKRSVEDSYDNLRSSAVSIKDVAEEFSKIAKLKFELYQLDGVREKKLTVLGKSIYPFLLENNFEGLKNHETLPVLLDEIKNHSNQIELIQHAIKDITQKGPKPVSGEDKQNIRSEIEALEKQIEARLNDLKAVKKALED